MKNWFDIKFNNVSEYCLQCSHFILTDYAVTPISPMNISMKNNWIRLTRNIFFIITANFLVLVMASPAQANNASSLEPFDRWSLDFDSGALFSIGSRASPLDYTILPQNLSLRGKALLRYEVRNGILVLRSRLSLLIQPIVQGPENYYMGLAAAPSLEWWNNSRTFSTFFSIGGGFGWMDSKGNTVLGAQGQDFNLNWFMHGGMRFQLTRQLSATTGLYFQHISNGGMDHINPGIDALGPTAGIGWQF